MDDMRDEPYPERPPAKTLEARELELVGLAVDIAEEQMRNRTVSAQVLTHYLKFATTRERFEQEKLRLENELLKARTEQIGSQAEHKKIAEEAIAAFRTYSGNDESYDDY